MQAEGDVRIEIFDLWELKLTDCSLDSLKWGAETFVAAGVLKQDIKGILEFHPVLDRIVLRSYRYRKKLGRNDQQANILEFTRMQPYFHGQEYIISKPPPNTIHQAQVQQTMDGNYLRTYSYQDQNCNQYYNSHCDYNTNADDYDKCTSDHHHHDDATYFDTYSYYNAYGFGNSGSPSCSRGH